MFNLGEHVFYPKGGVFLIEKQSQKHVCGLNIKCFDLVSFDGKTTISIPENNVDRVGVRSLLTPKELECALGSFKPDHKLTKLHHKNRKSRFEVLRQTGNFDDMGLVVTTIHNLIHKTKATFEEKRMYDQIRKRLVDEISVVNALDSDKANELLGNSLDEAIQRSPKETVEAVASES
ncbi:MAG: hypothetical protein KDC35_15220 [Acidobacteria bacterium]|nr:hypothetical protein [Acidobacteriota bacterium]